ncbi:MAG: phosphoribosylformylglycinamidine synthase, partial [Clostridia bacterium]|nr:phosphoribosylformylglycinamidine synthase [Clostridia bacterium]
MGTIAPNPYYTEDVAKRCMEEIFLPTISAMAQEGCPFKGCLYFGLMLTPNGPKVIEYNCRFGDPETQVVLPLLESDLFEIMQAVANETLSECEVKWKDGSACCVIMASKGYPTAYEKGFEIKVDEDFAGNLYVAGAVQKDGTLYTNGGRVLGVVATADTLGKAIEKAYGEVEHVHFDNAFFRRDIGKSAMKAKGESQSMVYRIYCEKKPEQAHEAKGLLSDLQTFLGIENLTGLRLVNRYDVENIEKEDLDRAIPTIFSEPPTDVTFEELETKEGEFVFAVSFLPGQFDMRADSAAQCIQLMTQKERPTVRYAKVYVLEGELSEEDIAKIKKYVINPVESGEVTLEKFDTLQMTVTPPEEVPTLDGFIHAGKEEIAEMVKSYGLAMDEDDLLFCQEYFKKVERRDPTLTELRVIDTYWSDHCRHTTFLTEIDQVTFEDEELQATYEAYLAAREELGRTKPVTLMDIGTLAAKYLKSKGMLDKLDESEEINACTVKTTVKVDGEEVPYLLLFKNETHNHPTEIEPFGGAATCIGGAIRDPLSGRSYVYAAMRVTGAADPTKPLCETIEGKLPQRKLVATAAAGYSSYGNQIGLATGQVDELYHDGYVAKHMEIGAVLGAAPAANVRREVPKAGDAIILLGGRTGRDGCGGATGSSKSHTVGSLTECGAEVQKGNAPEERKLQRLFRNPEATSMIVRCNDFGAGGVSVAVGELADGLYINLNTVPKKYEGLSGTELAISESQERMAVVVAKEDAARFIKLAKKENLEATQIAAVIEKPRLVMYFNGKQIVSLARSFLNSNGAKKHITVEPPKSAEYTKTPPQSFADGYNALLSDLNVCSKRGLSERFDSTIGTGSVLMPFGGKKQLSPIQTMIHRFPVLGGKTEDCSAMAWGYNPFIAEKAPYHSAYLAVVESVSKLIASGASFEDVYLTFQEYFAKPGKDPKRWGVP